MATVKTGDKIRLTHDGRTVEAWVVLASANGRSLMVGFEAIIAGCVGMMPVLQGEDGVYRTLIGGDEIKIEVTP